MGTKSNRLPWFKFNVDEFLNEAAHLSTIERGVYISLLCWYWKNGPLPDDLNCIGRIAVLRPDNIRKIVPRILNDLFIDTRPQPGPQPGPRWRHAAMDAILSQAIEKSKVKSTNVGHRYNGRTTAAPQTLDRRRKKEESSASPNSFSPNSGPSGKKEQGVGAELPPALTLTEEQWQRMEAAYPAWNAKEKHRKQAVRYTCSMAFHAIPEEDRERALHGFIKNRNKEQTRGGVFAPDEKEAERQKQIACEKRDKEARAMRVAYLEQQAAKKAAKEGSVH